MEATVERQRTFEDFYRAERTGISVVTVDPNGRTSTVLAAGCGV